MRQLELNYKPDWSIEDFILENQMTFEAELLEEASTVKDKITEIQYIGNINLVENAHKLVLFIVEDREEELIAFAKQEGVVWAKYSMTLAFKLEWIHAIRRTVWRFLKEFDRLNESRDTSHYFFMMEKRINDHIDQFLTNFFISYSKFKDGLLDQQRELVENLSVPIIPINDTIRILPLIGEMDTIRIRTIQEKVLEEIGRNHIQTLIMDLSGIPPLKEETPLELKKIIEAISMMGCRTILTGLRSEVVQSLIESVVDLRGITEFKGTLQLALNDVMNG